MLTRKKTRPNPTGGPTAKTGGRPPPRGRLTTFLKGLLCVALVAQLFPSARFTPSVARTAPKRHDTTQQYRAGGTRWLDSRADEVVHFICQGGAPYTISLETASLQEARIAVADHPRFLGALRQAVSDWSALMGCNRIRVELDSAYPDTRIYFSRIDAPGTLATATRAGDIMLNVRRDWFPGSRRHGNYGPEHRSVSFYWVVAHELGHVWGLAHADSPESLMYPSQCHTCRWSSFEQAAGNVIRASSETPGWSRPHYANRFFAKTPRTVVRRLLKGDLPDTPALAEAPDGCEPQTCVSEAPPADPQPEDGCGTEDLPDPAALTGWPLFRLPRALPNPRRPRLERLKVDSTHRRSHDRNSPDPPFHGRLMAVLAPFDPGRSLWKGDPCLRC